MAKQTIKLSKFSGGINTVDSNRALVDDQTPFAKNCDVSKEGRIGVLGNALTSYGNVNDSTAVGDPGYGLFVFSHDYDMLSGANALKATPVNVSTTYICKATSTGISVYDKTNGFWYANLITFDDSDEADDPLPIFYLADGALRVCDTNSPDDKVKWLGHIKRSLFLGNLDYNAWHSQNAELHTSTVANVNSAGNGSPLHVQLCKNANDNEFPAASSATANVFASFKEDTSATPISTWNASQSIEMWVSGIYDVARQEGPLVSIGQLGAPDTASAQLKLGVSINITSDPAGVLDPRMIGIKIYYSDNNDSVETAYQLAEVDFVKGVKKSGGTGYTAFTQVDSYTYMVPSTMVATGAGVLVFSDPPYAGTYDAKNGHYSDEETKVAFKSAVVVGRRCYAGNISFQKGATGNTWKSDQMVKSAFNQFDKFPEFNSSTTAVNDGDDIVALVDVGSQLLQFKRTSLYVLDVTETGESVNAKHDFRGISRPCHVTKTPMGVMWINETGLHLYAGDGKIQNLITGKISTEVWNFSDNMSLGYNDEFSKIIVAKDVNIYNSVTNPDAGDALVFDLKSMSWMEGGKILSDIGAKTNFQTTPEGDIIYAVDGEKTGYIYTTNDVTFKFFGKLKKYSTAFSSQAWEQSQYPWKLLPNDDTYVDGNRDVAPFQGVERTIIDWQNDNHFINASSWTGGDAQYSATPGNEEFLDYDRFSISYKDPTAGAEDADGNLMFGGYLSASQDPTSETFYCVPIAVNGNIGTDVTKLSIAPAGKTSLGTTLNRLREVVGSVMANNTNGEGAKTFDDMIAASAVDSTFASYAVSSGALWSISLDTPGNDNIDDVEFSLSVTVDLVTDLTVTGASILKWSNQPVNSENFRYYTKDIDFGSSSAGKRISITYITYKSISSRDALDDVPIPTNSNIHPMLHLTTDTGLYTVIPDVANSTNYSATLGLLGDTNDWMQAKIKWKKKDVNDKDVPSVIQSAQLVLYRDPTLNSAALVVGGFELSDISFSFKMKTVK